MCLLGRLTGQHRRDREEALRQSELRFAAILEQLPVGVGLFDHEGRLQQANTLLRRFIDGELLPSKDPQAGERWRALQADGRLLEPSAYPGTRALSGEPVIPGIDFLHTLEDGREIWTRVGAAPFRDETGRITGIVEVVQNIDQEKRAAQANLLLIAELQHRTRNLLAVVNSLVEETVESCSSVDDFAVTLRSRLAALSRVQGLLSREDNRAVMIGELVRLELRALGAEPDGHRVAVAGPDAALPRRSVQILALALHELGTNARKHGALRTPEGHLAVTWVVRIVDSRPRLTLHWHESWIAERANAEPARKGFGRVLIEELLPLQLDAETYLAFGDGELHCSVTMAI
jgi:two-component sensor histidine kinase